MIVHCPVCKSEDTNLDEKRKELDCTSCGNSTKLKHIDLYENEANALGIDRNTAKWLKIGELYGFDSKRIEEEFGRV